MLLVVLQRRLRRLGYLGGSPRWRHYSGRGQPTGGLGGSLTAEGCAKRRVPWVMFGRKRHRRAVEDPPRTDEVSMDRAPAVGLVSGHFVPRSLATEGIAQVARPAPKVVLGFTTTCWDLTTGCRTWLWAAGGLSWSGSPPSLHASWDVGWCEPRRQARQWRRGRSACVVAGVVLDTTVATRVATRVCSGPARGHNTRGA